MSERRAYVIVCDDLFFSPTGKLTISGMYQTDLGAFPDGILLNQLCFLFTIETPLQNPFRDLKIRITAPGNDPVLMPVPIPPIAQPPTGRTQLIIRHAYLMQRFVLRPGRIETTVIHESGEIDAGGIWVAEAPLS